MQDIQLEDEEVDRLLTVLDQNVQATGRTDAIRWTNAAAARIDRVKRNIEQQTDQE